MIFLDIKNLRIVNGFFSIGMTIKEGEVVILNSNALTISVMDVNGKVAVIKTLDWFDKASKKDTKKFMLEYGARKI